MKEQTGVCCRRGFGRWEISCHVGAAHEVAVGRIRTAQRGSNRTHRTLSILVLVPATVLKPLSYEAHLSIIQHQPLAHLDDLGGPRCVLGYRDEPFGAVAHIPR